MNVGMERAKGGGGGDGEEGKNHLGRTGVHDDNDSDLGVATSRNGSVSE